MDQHVFMHLSSAEDKVSTLTAMLTKLYALVDGHCGEDSADALTHHEILLPGHLLMKAMHERLSVWLQTFGEQVVLFDIKALFPFLSDLPSFLIVILS